MVVSMAFWAKDGILAFAGLAGSSCGEIARLNLIRSEMSSLDLRLSATWSIKCIEPRLLGGEGREKLRECVRVLDMRRERRSPGMFGLSEREKD